MEQYIRRHIGQNAYFPTDKDAHSFRNRNGWQDHLIGPHLLYSHRKTAYTQDSFDETLHFHEHFELVLYVRGDVDYVNGNALFSPAPMAMLRFLPGELHTTRLKQSSLYERYVFLFREESFSYGGNVYPLPAFLQKDSPGCFILPMQKHAELTALLARLDTALTDEKGDGRLLAFALTVELFTLLDACSAASHSNTPASLPARMLEIKEYIDTHYATIESVSELASHFFYSREYISRLFRRYYNTSVAGYLSRYRVQKSLSLLEQGKPVTEVAFAVGFGSMSAYICAFKKNMGLLPSQYAGRR